MSDPGAGAPTRTLTVGTDEIRQIDLLTSVFCPLDERNPAGSVHIAEVRGSRRWLIGHPTGMVDKRLDTVELDPPSDWILPKRIIRAAAAFDAPSVRFSEHSVDGELFLTAEAGHASATIPLVHGPEAALLSWANRPSHTSASATVAVSDLTRLVSAARFAPHDVDDSDAPLFWISLEEGALSIEINWTEFGRSRYSLRGQGSGSAITAANPAQLADVLTTFEGDVTIQMTTDPDDVMVLASDDHRAIITPIMTTHERLRSALERALAEAFGELALRRDADGDYSINQFDTPIYARLLDDRPARVRLFAILLDDVDETPELYRELNELNSSVSFARLTWWDRRVYGSVDLVASTLDVDELLVAADRIHRVSTDFIPSVGALYGGVRPDEQGDRWRLYRQTIIEAEIQPGQWLVVAGPGAVAQWELPEEVFVLTAWNPLGMMASDQENADANLALQVDLIRDGGRVTGAVGRSYDGSHTEGSLLMWGLPIEAATFYGRKYNQDAIFRLTAVSMELISCDDDRREAWPRTEASVPQ